MADFAYKMDKKMTRSLRRWHFSIWVILGFFIVVVFFSARPSDAGGGSLDTAGKTDSSYPEVVAEKKLEELEVKLRQSSKTPLRQLEFQLTQNKPSVTVYLSTGREREKTALGLLGNSSIQRIELDSALSRLTSYKIEVFDNIEDVLLYEFELRP